MHHDESSQAAFERWWHRTGSQLTPLPGHDHEEHAKRVANLAWSFSRITPTRRLNRLADAIGDIIEIAKLPASNRRFMQIAQPARQILSIARSALR